MSQSKPICWSSLLHAKVHRFISIPNLILYFYRFVKLYILFYTGLLPFVPLKETHLEIPMPSIFYDDNYRLAKPDGVSRLEFGHRMNTF